MILCGLLARLQGFLVRRAIFVGIILRIIGGFKKIFGKNNWEIEKHNRLKPKYM